MVADVDLAFPGEGVLELREDGVESAGTLEGGLGAGSGGDVSQGRIAVAPDIGREVVLYLQGGQQRGLGERQLYLVAHLVGQQQQAKGLFEVEVHGRQEKLRLNDVTAGVGVVAIRHSDCLKLFEVAEDRSPAGPEYFREVRDGVALSRLHRCQDMYYPADSAVFHSVLPHPALLFRHVISCKVRIRTQHRPLSLR